MLVLQSYPIHEKAVGASALLLDECSFSDRSAHRVGDGAGDVRSL